MCRVKPRKENPKQSRFLRSSSSWKHQCTNPEWPTKGNREASKIAFSRSAYLSFDAKKGWDEVEEVMQLRRQTDRQVVEASSGMWPAMLIKGTVPAAPEVA